MSQSLVMGSTYRFQLTVTKDGAVWDLSAGTVHLHLRDPSGTVTDYTATALNASGGVFKYDCSTSDLDAVGMWERAWTVTDGSVVCETEPENFYVARGL